MKSDVLMDSQSFRSALGKYPTGVVIVTGADECGVPVGGMTAGTFSSVSLEPMLVSFMPMKTSTSWPRIERTGKFCINVLSVEQESLCRVFAKSGGDKFDGIKWITSNNGLPILPGSVLSIDCDLYSVSEAGDHLIVLGEVRSVDVHNDAEPLIFLKGKFSRAEELVGRG